MCSGRMEGMSGTKKTMAFDPGTNGLGWAYFLGMKLVDCGTIYGPKKDNWKDRSWTITQQLDSMLYQFRANAVLIEKPYIALSGKSLVSAKRQDVIKLTLLAGKVWQLTETHYGNIARFVDVVEWKGQLPKALCHRRIIHQCKEKDIAKQSEHSLDAIGIGLWHLGRF